MRWHQSVKNIGKKVVSRRARMRERDRVHKARKQAKSTLMTMILNPSLITHGAVGNGEYNGREHFLASKFFTIWEVATVQGRARRGAMAAEAIAKLVASSGMLLPDGPEPGPSGGGGMENWSSRAKRKSMAGKLSSTNSNGAARAAQLVNMPPPPPQEASASFATSSTSSLKGAREHRRRSYRRRQSHQQPYPQASSGSGMDSSESRPEKKEHAGSGPAGNDYSSSTASRMRNVGGSSNDSSSQIRPPAPPRNNSQSRQSSSNRTRTSRTILNELSSKLHFDDPGLEDF